MNRQLGALSGLAMLLIIVNHSIQMGTTVPLELGYAPVEGVGRYLLFGLQALGAFAVPVFLFVSGSFITYAARGEAALSYRFIGASLRHIMFPYLFWSLVFYMVVFLHYGEQYSPLGYVRNLLVGYPFHFVPLLAFYYLLSPVLVRLGKRYGWLLLAAIGLYQLLLIPLSAPQRFGFPFADPLRFLFPPVLGNTMADWGIYFPLGLVFSLHAASLRPWLRRLRWGFVTATVALFVLGVLDAFAVVQAPLARYLCPVALLLVVPVIERNAIPYARPLEKLGKRSYGLYLTHLIVLDLALWGIQVVAPFLFHYVALLYPLLFLVALQVPLFLMEYIARPPMFRSYRYVFG
jgi:peptidoglycan/LPS O-acetylase OafA/YrhL